jgi:thymidylate synthase (FAD)
MTGNPNTRSILNAGSVTLLEMMGDDLDIVNAARVSFASSQISMDQKGIGLINFLMKNKHATPFEHVVFKFHVKCPIFVAREWFRHRWSSFNEMSMRYYVPDQIDFFVPQDFTIRQQVGKPGHYEFEPITDESKITYIQDRMEEIYEAAESAYNELLEMGLAKELARAILPVGQYTEFIWTVNLRSLLNFVSLRNDSHAQYEINAYASAIEDMISSLLPVTYKSFIENGRQAI